LARSQWSRLRSKLLMVIVSMLEKWHGKH
jgi:hypothetical protein